ncbi:TetR/AcrR family transcriptional regulator [Nonomuraea sp. NPDC049400]|uniref:TetR/AcrR family transcriptional regulator n=1 Tax=Nonomuraea sp. NPDC049400 TaxID=3364352 RepID=UPI0037A72E31
MEESRRERKKRQTRQLLVSTALRLFAEQGYEQTTVAQIAAAADVATKTFFNYFPTKEDVLFAQAAQYMELSADVVAAREPADGLAEVLLKAYEQVIAHYLTVGPMAGDRELTKVYEQVVMTVPAVQARALHLLFDLQRELARQLLTAFPDQLDPISAAVVAGIFMGAVQSAGNAARELGQSSDEEIMESMRRGVEIAMRGLRSF